MMQPYYQDDYATIYHGDCREILPGLPKVDTVFTSPPYNTIAPKNPSGFMKKSHNKKLNGYLSHDDDMPESMYQEWLVGILNMCFAKCEGIMWVNHKTRYRNKKGIHPLDFLRWPFYSEIVWDCCGSTTQNARKYAPSHEFIYGFGVPHY